MRKKIKINNYLFVQDGFGPLPVWSLMHPTKEARDAYSIELSNIKNKPKWLEDILIIQSFADKLSHRLKITPADIYGVYVSGEITVDNKRIIKDFKMDYWRVEGTILKGENKCS